MTAFKDHFSGHAKRYAKFRPNYPDALYAWLASQCASNDHAWDCATGNGQAARQLARYFTRVSATDASAAQIDNAVPGEGVHFAVAAAESSGLDAASVDLITVAQALHWFDIPRFFAHAATVLKPDGCIAVWTYQLFTVSDAVDALVNDFYERALEGWWPPERELVVSGYQGIIPDWPRRPDPGFVMRQDWCADEALGYLSSWSAVQRCIRDTGRDPVAEIADELRESWGGERRAVCWPLILHTLSHPDAR